MSQPLYTTLPVKWGTREEMLESVPKGSVGAEIGVWKGDFSAEILRIVKPNRLLLIDPWAPAGSGDHFDQTSQEHHNQFLTQVKERFETEITITFRIQIVRATSPVVSSNFRDEELDWVYIDGNHTFDGVTADLKAWWPKVVAGGLIMGHDYLDYPLSTTRVKSAVDGWLRDQKKAVPIGQTSEMPRLPGLPTPPPESPRGTRSFMIRKEK